VNANKELWEKGDFTRILERMRDSGDALVDGLGITFRRPGGARRDHHVL
jgi:hypothetical protein